METEQGDKAQNWTVGTTVSGGEKFPAIMCGKKVVWFTCLSSDRNELRQLCHSHNASITAEREKFRIEHEVQLSWKRQCGKLREQLATTLHEIGLLSCSGERGDQPLTKLDAIARRCQKELAKVKEGK